MDRAGHFSHNIRLQKRGISPIIATLLLILIAIAAGVVVYAYVIGFVGQNQTSAPQTETLAINAWTFAGGNLTIFVQNTGQSQINVTQAFVYSTSGTLISGNVSLGSGAQGTGYVINPGEAVAVVAKGMSGVTKGQYYKVEVVTKDGYSATSSPQQA
jgi:archaeal type IV pilus assembly protein PilA